MLMRYHLNAMKINPNEKYVKWDKESISRLKESVLYDDSIVSELLEYHFIYGNNGPEFLPITVGGEEWAILNAINMQDVIDVANSHFKIRSDLEESELPKQSLVPTRFHRGTAEPFDVVPDPKGLPLYRRHT